jgi:type II secretory pathway pseudopilin PulG
MTKDSGFTVIEVLIAFICVSLGLVSVYTALALHYRQAGLAELHNSTLLYAESQLDAVGHSIPLVPGEFVGRYANGARWRLAINPIEVGGQDAAPGPRPLKVEIDTFSPSGKALVRLVTVKILEPQR